MKDMLTEEEKIDYIEGGYGECPYCGSTDIVGHSVEISGNSAYQDVTCSDCNRKWCDSYVLVDILETPEEPEPEDKIDSIWKTIPK